MRKRKECAATVIVAVGMDGLREGMSPFRKDAEMGLIVQADFL